MKKGWIIARDHKTDLNVARQYYTGPEWSEHGTWSTDPIHATRFTAQERNREMKWIRSNTPANTEVFYYKD